MQLVRRQDTWNPLRELEQFGNRLTRMFEMTPWFGENVRENLAVTDWTPSCNIAETDKEYHIRAELPDVKRDDVHVTLDQNVLTIQGERREEKEDKGIRFHRRELSYGKFTRSFTMPDDADEAKVDANFKDGILEVVIGKSKAKAHAAREISVH
jgi:HSP20 family protein